MSLHETTTANTVDGGHGSDTLFQDYLSLRDWRQRISDLYTQVRHLPPEGAWNRWRETRHILFSSHPQSPIPASRRAGFAGPSCFPYDPAMRFLVGLRPAGTVAPLTMPAGADGSVSLTPYAKTVGLAGKLGRELTLYWIGGYGGGVFLPVADQTNGVTTFGGGRYLLDTIKGADLGFSRSGEMIVDFNFCYFPSCAYSDRWVCPLPPRDNRVPAPIEAGERLP